MSTAQIRLTTTGIETPLVRVPPLTIRGGEVVRLVEPDGVSFFRLLEREASFRDSFQVTTNAHHQVPLLLHSVPYKPPVRWQLFRPLRAIDWVSRQARIPPQEAAEILVRCHVDPEMRLDHMAGNPRGLTALATMLAQRPAAIIFHTYGLDPLGQQQLLETVFAELGDVAAIYCQSRVLTQGKVVVLEHDLPFAQMHYLEGKDGSQAEAVHRHRKFAG